MEIEKRVCQVFKGAFAWWSHWCANCAEIVIIVGLLIINTFPALFWVGIAMFAMVFLFSVVTLPVEFNASKRALAWLQSSNSLGEQEVAQAKEALGWAASTYVVAALSSLASLLYYIGLGSRR